MSLELRAFVADVADDYCAEVDGWGTYEAVTTLYADHERCP